MSLGCQVLYDLLAQPRAALALDCNYQVREAVNAIQPPRPVVVRRLPPGQLQRLHQHVAIHDITTLFMMPASTWSTQADDQKNNKAAATKAQQAEDHKAVAGVAKPTPSAASAPVEKNVAQASAPKQQQYPAAHEESEWMLFRGFLSDNWDKALMILFNGLLAAYTYGLWRSTDRLTSEAKSSGVFAKAAADAAKASADSMKLAERAYIKISFLNNAVKWGPTKTGLEVDVLVENFGRTPSTVTDIRLGVRVLENEDLLPNEFPYPLNEVRQSIPSAFLMPRDTHSFDRYFGFKKESYEAVTDSAKRLWVFGHVDYIDIFGTRHRSGIARLYEPILEGGENGNLMFCRQRRYDFDRERAKGDGEGSDWGEPAPA